jgi:hypothetical protein
MLDRGLERALNSLRELSTTLENIGRQESPQTTSGLGSKALRPKI